MTYIVTEPCIGTKDRACVEVCPVECFYEATDQLYIHPDECIDCAACEPVCPVTAIFPEDSVPDQYKSYTEKNYKFDYTNAPHALTKQMLGDQDNFGTTFTVEGKTITLPPPYGDPAPPAPTAEAAPAPAPAAAAPAPPKVEAVPAAAAPAPAAAAPAAAPVRAVAGDAVSQLAEAAAAAAEAAARAAEAAAAAVRLLQGKADGRTVSGAPSAQVVHPQSAPAAKPADAKAVPKAEAAAPAQGQAEAPMVAAPDPSFEHAKEVLYALIDFESEARAADPEELTRAEQTATSLFDEIAKAVGKRDYDLPDLEKKDVALRQKMELANSIVDHVGRARLQIEVKKQRGRTRRELPGVVGAFAIAVLCAAPGLYYALKYSFSTAGGPTPQDLVAAPFTPEGFMPFLGFNLLGGLFALFGLLALLRLGRSWVETCQIEALRPQEFGAASLRPRRWSWTYRLNLESQRVLETQRMLQGLAAKKR